ncbi:MAG: hypothetical protein CSB13_08680 [Chloroflexi bacterium]|nr:MAG: hypothetical protein CSB13_08680 [Chloroflexota bacterium]
MVTQKKKTKYDELCQAYRTSRKNLLIYQDECQVFARDIVNGMIEYFEWPTSQEITYIPLGEGIDPSNRFYAISAAMQMDDDSFWHFGLELSVEEPGGSYPLPFLLSFFIKKIGNVFVVKLGPKGKEFKIPENRRRDLEPLYDIVFKHITHFFNYKYQDAITKGLNDPDFIMLSPTTSTTN